METVLLFILGVLIILVGLVLSIGLHELGHLSFAKLFKVRVGQYMIGFGPTLWSKKIGETEYGVKGIPLGGYISMAGMYPPAKRGTTAVAADAGRTSTTSLFNVLVQEARDSSAKTIDEGHEDRVFYKLSPWKRIIVMLAGPAMNLVLGLIFTLIVVSGFGLPLATTTIAAVGDGSPAAVGGLKVGDRVLSIDGTPITGYPQMTALIRAHADEQMAVVVDRDGSRETLQLTPKRQTVQLSDQYGNPETGWNGKPVTADAGFLGIGPSSRVEHLSLGDGLAYFGYNVGQMTKVIATFPVRVYNTVAGTIQGEKRQQGGPVSIVGVGELAGQAAAAQAPVAARAQAMISILGQLNLALFLFNLIPLLPLDGGHVIGAVWEAVRRRVAALFKRRDPGPVDMARLTPLTVLVTGVLALMSLSLIVIDLVNPLSIT
ncbi:M50 family metallopeptidase [Pseudolysinimonas sp.]|uniref:M50 family metallopeptidase n=1 Tax=Pseudolysinimonas sp. TaxID=2680009 RepID=UPI003F7F11D0